MEKIKTQADLDKYNAEELKKLEQKIKLGKESNKK